MKKPSIAERLGRRKPSLETESPCEESEEITEQKDEDDSAEPAKKIKRGLFCSFVCTPLQVIVIFFPP
jgi:hypothetical protein